MDGNKRTSDKSEAQSGALTRDECLGDGCALENRHWYRSIGARRCPPSKSVPSDRKGAHASRVVPVRKGRAVHFKAYGAFIRVDDIVAEVCAGAHDRILVLFGRTSCAVIRSKLLSIRAENLDHIAAVGRKDDDAMRIGPVIGHLFAIGEDLFGASEYPCADKRWRLRKDRHCSGHKGCE